LPELPEHKVFKEFKVSRALPAFREFKVYRESKVSRGLLE
jgi:hypothetical protein